jgi:hypothetical protein
MIKLKELITEDADSLVYRGISNLGNRNLGKLSRGVVDRLVATLGPNYTENLEIAQIFAGESGKLMKKQRTGNVLKLQHYNDITDLYRDYNSLLTPGSIAAINAEEKDSDAQLKVIQRVGKELRNVLSMHYSWVQVPFKESDKVHFLGLEGEIFINLNSKL